MNDVISLSDIAYWVSRKFEADKSAPMLTIQMDSGRRMMQISTATPMSGGQPYVYVVVGRHPETFMSEPIIDFIFLEGPCASLERLLQLVEDTTVKRMTIDRITSFLMVDIVETTVAESLWDYFTKRVPQPA